MGERGPKVKATNLRILEGNPSKRPLNSSEPNPEPGAECPEWLSAPARVEWQRLAPILDQCGILTRADADALAIYCDALVNYRRATAEIESMESLVYEGSHGEKVAPMISVQRNYVELLVKMGTKLGLSPSDRHALKVENPNGGSRWAGKLTGINPNQQQLGL